MSSCSLKQLLATLIISVMLTAHGLAADSSFFSTRSKGLAASLEFKQAPLRSMQPTPFQLTVNDSHGKQISGLKLSCDLSMPAMAMPPNEPKVTEQSGVYTGEAIFTMAGGWRATFNGTTADGHELALTFEIPDVKMK